MRAERRNRSDRLFDFGLVVLSVAVALGLTLLLTPWLYPTVTPLFFVAVMISAWLGGWETGLLATVLSTLAVNYFFIEPLYSLQIINIGTVVRLSLFAIAAGLVSYLTRSQRMALERFRANYQTLKETMEREEAAQARDSQAKEALRQSEARLRAVAANLPQGAAFVVDRNLRYLLAEGKALEEVGMTSENLVGKTIWEALAPDLAAIYEPYFRQALKGEPFSWEHNSHDRHYISHGTPLVNDRGEVYAVLAMSYDITERKRVEERLRESEEKFRTFANTIPVLMWQQDAEGKNVWVNQYFINFAGKTAEEISGKGWEKLLHPDDAEKFVAGFMEAVRTRQPWHGRVRSRRYDSEWRWVESFAQPLFGSDGAYLGHVGATPDITATVEAEATLRESEERFRTLISASSNVLYRMSADWSEMQELQGGNFLADTPKPSRNWLQNYIHPDDRAQVLAAIHAAIEAKGLFELEHRVIRADGTIGWTYSRAVPLLNATGEIVEWFGEASDITDRKRREANLAFLAEIQNDCARLTTADEIMQTVGAKIGSYLNLSICAFVDVDEAQERAIVHHTWHREDAPNLIGTYRISEFVTEAFYTAVRAGDIIIVNDTNTDARTHAQNCAVLNIQAFIHVPLLREGQWKFLFNGYDSRPRQWQEDEIDLFRELANHIFPRLERARAEEAVAADLQDTQLLRELGARLVTEGDFQILYQEIIAAAITITQAQAGTLQLLDAATNELVMLASQNIPLEMSEPFCRIDASFNTSCGVALRVGERSFVDFDVPESEDSHGSLRLLMEAGYLSAQSTPLITRSGRLIGMVSNHWRTHYRPSDRQLRFLDLLARQAADLIEQRQTEAERERLLQQAQAARAEAEQTNRIKDEFLAVLSHELRSPLNPILGWSRLLQNGKLDAAKTAQALTTIERNAKLQSELIEDLLDVSRILQGKLSLNVSPVHLAATIRGAIETVRLAADAKSVAVEAKLDSEVGQVSGDATRLQQVVWNLLSNAVKFTPVGGRVEVRLEQVNGQAQITVSDNGKGISATFLPHVFDHFRQEDGATTRKFGGLGLGLAIVRHLVELHGGTVEVASAGEGLGAMFTVKLPLLRTENRELRTENLAPSTQYSALRPLEGLQILVIDDETDSREFVAFVLEQAGASVTTAATASAGFLAFTQSPPDVLISDIGMPDMDGYMLMRQVRRLPLEQGGQVKAIALTAYAGEGDQQQALHTGFQQHLAKPVEPDTLVRAIAKLLRRNL